MHSVYKQASTLIINPILEIEELLIQLSIIKDSSQYKKIIQLNYWKIILELSFNFFIWIAAMWDRSSVKKIFKGPKFGTLKEQNIDSLLNYMYKANQEPNDFIIPLDFCRYCCIGDLLEISLKEPELVLRLSVYECKSGKVNDEMLDIIRNQDQTQYFDFFDKYGSGGIKQIERYFRQMTILTENSKLLFAEPDSCMTLLINIASCSSVKMKQFKKIIVIK